MTSMFLVVAAVLVVVGLVVAYLVLLAWDRRQARGRTQRHHDAGGRPGDAPDWSPGHTGGGGAVGG